MFKQLLALLKKGDLVSQALEDYSQMINKASRLFNESFSVLSGDRTPSFDIYEMDRNINSIEKKIRRKILEHLSINPKQDIVASLVLTSIVIDIERIGDYSKNIYELKDFYNDGEKPSISSHLKIEAKFISKMFGEVAKCLISGDAEEAKVIMDKLNPVKKGFDIYIQEAASRTKRSTRKTIVNVLFSRYLKRISAHLENIASSIVNPFDMIGFYQDDPDKEAD